MRIQKTSETRPLTGSVVNEYNTSDKNAYSSKYINEINTYSENETFTGKYHTDGKKIYRKVLKTTGSLNPGAENRVGSIDNLDNLILLTGTGVLSSQYYVPIPYISNTDNVSIYIRNVNNVYRPTIVPQSANVTNINIIVEYTKTTD